MQFQYSFHFTCRMRWTVVLQTSVSCEQCLSYFLGRCMRTSNTFWTLHHDLQNFPDCALFHILHPAPPSALILPCSTEMVKCVGGRVQVNFSNNLAPFSSSYFSILLKIPFTVLMCQTNEHNSVAAFPVFVVINHSLGSVQVLIFKSMDSADRRV